jgi:threonine-phosphate decarboxylase
MVRDLDFHGGKIREAAARLGRRPEEMLDFSANINFLGPGAEVTAAAHAALEEMAWYPADPPLQLRQAAATFLTVPREAVLLGNGASELIFLVVAHFRPRRVLILGPTFTEYERAARAWGAEVDVLSLPAERGFRLTEEEVDRADLDRRLARAQLLFVCDPNNPTGALLDKGLRSLLFERAAAADVPVFVDESFLAFTLNWPAGSATLLGLPHVIVLHSFTKILAMPGLRVGALVVPAAWQEELSARVPPWNLNCVAQTAALTALAQARLLADTPAAVAESREALARALAALPGVAQILPADANFLCLRLAAPVVAALTARLRDEHAVLVRDLSLFPGMGPHYLRVAVRSPGENESLVRAMSLVLQDLTPAVPSSMREAVR